MGINKIILNTSDGEKVLVDLTGDTVTPEKLEYGATAHDASGAEIVGKYVPLDTSDATATADDIVSGVTAYVNGEKITGTIRKEWGGITAEVKPVVGYLGGSQCVQFGYTPEEPNYISPSTGGVYLQSPFDNFGDASAEDVAKGKTFTSASGLNVVGTMEEGSSGDPGLPAGYSRVDFIEFTGRQLIDTGIIGNQDTQIQTSFTWGNATQNHVFGCASPDNTASITSYMNGSWRFGNKSVTKTIQKNNTLLPYAARINKTMIGITGSSSAISGVNDFETIDTLLLGGARSSNGELPGTGFVGRVLYFDLWSGEEQVLKLRPVTDGQGVYRFWDTVGQRFYDSITDTPLGGGNL